MKMIKRFKLTKKRLLWGTGAVLLMAAVILGLWLSKGNGTDKHAVAEAVHPEESVYTEMTMPESFLTSSIPRLLSCGENENRVCSPVSVYMALSMLAEVTDGNSRAQILSLLGADSVTEQRERARQIWNNYYINGDNTKCVLASSLWLNEKIEYVPKTVKTLADCYYASCFSGKMGSDDYNRAMQDWLNEQTGGFLADHPVNELTPETVMAMLSTVFFEGGWMEPFSEGATLPEIFHAPEGDITCDYMRAGREGYFYQMEHFSAVSEPFWDRYSMWFILPEEGTAPNELLYDEELLDLFAGHKSGDPRYAMIRLALPKFDVSSDLDLLPVLKELGITDALDDSLSDFTPLTDHEEQISVSKAKQSARVTVDEDGCTAAAYTEFEIAAGAALTEPKLEIIEFTVDRPFIFVIVGRDYQPLFAGIVNEPIKSANPIVVHFNS